MAALGVGCGAFGAHGLRNLLDAAALAWWHTAVDYLMWHALGLLAIGASRLERVGVPVLLLLGGTLIFAGTLMALALGAPRALGILTPVGGLGMLAGWLAFAWVCLRAQVGPRQ